MINVSNNTLFTLIFFAAWPYQWWIMYIKKNNIYFQIFMSIRLKGYGFSKTTVFIQHYSLADMSLKNSPKYIYLGFFYNTFFCLLSSSSTYSGLWFSDAAHLMFNILLPSFFIFNPLKSHCIVYVSTYFHCNLQVIILSYCVDVYKACKI